MNLVLDSFSKLLGNLILFFAIPFIWWLVGYRKKESFFKWIGLYKPSATTPWWVVLTYGLVYILYYKSDWTVLMPLSDFAVVEQSESVVANAYRAGLGSSAPAPSKTSLRTDYAKSYSFGDL